jgi:Peptidase family M23
MARKYWVLLDVLLLVLFGCGRTGGGGGNCENPISTLHPSTSAAPELVFSFGLASDATPTELSSDALRTALLGLLSFSGCGAFGVYESGNGGEIATEIEMRFSQRMGVFALADGVVVYIQPSSAPLESGEVEGVWVRYGSNYVIKYVHVVNPTVSEGDLVSAGDKLGTTVLLSQGGSPQYFWEVEVQRRSGSSISSLAWNSLLKNTGASPTHKARFDSMYGAAGTNCTAASGTSNWKANSNTSGEIDTTERSQPCAFP